MIPKDKGAIGELLVASHLLKQGWHVLFPYGENHRYDLVVEKSGQFRRLQVKYCTPKNNTLRVNCRSSNNWSVLQYTADEIDAYAVYDPLHDHVYFVPIHAFKNRNLISLRIGETKNQQTKKIHNANEFAELK